MGHLVVLTFAITIPLSSYRFTALGTMGNDLSMMHLGADDTNPAASSTEIEDPSNITSYGQAVLIQRVSFESRAIELHDGRKAIVEEVVTMNATMDEINSTLGDMKTTLGEINTTLSSMNTSLGQLVVIADRRSL